MWIDLYLYLDVIHKHMMCSGAGGQFGHWLFSSLMSNVKTGKVFFQKE